MMSVSEVTVEAAQEIADTVEHYLGLGWLDVRERYSGRGMYGDEVVALVGDSDTDDAAVFIAIGMLIERGEFPDDAMHWFGRKDSMGLGWVRY